MKSRIEASEYFAILPEAVLYAPISAQAVRLYCILRRRADEKNNSCYPSQSYLAKTMLCSVRTVQRAVDELVNIGAITVQNRKLKETDAYTSNLYILHATIAQGSAQVRKPMANMSEGSGAGGVQNIANKQSKETDKGKSKRKKDLLFEEMCNQLGIDWNNATKNELGKVNAACKQLRDIKATPEELKEVAEYYKKNWKVTISATAIANNWSQLKNEIKPTKVHKRDCALEGHVWIDLDVIYKCQFCKKEVNQKVNKEGWEL